MAKDHSYQFKIYAEWKSRISKKDPLREAKNNKLKQAIDLCYGEEALEKIVTATTEMQLYRAMLNARSIA
jgi:hypothetical protein